MFDKLPKYFIRQGSFCPWNAGIDGCTGGCSNAPPLHPTASNGSYVLQFMRNATDEQLVADRKIIEDLGGNVTRVLPKRGLFWETWVANFADRLYPELNAGLAGLRKMNYDLPF
eukprot:SAG31_NODE_22536_length_523_cov_1.094340_1_plen_114_part_00